MSHISNEISEFEGKLGDIVSQALNINSPEIGYLKACALYSTATRLHAFRASRELNIPQELAIAYMALMVGAGIQSNTGHLKQIFSKSTKNLLNEHRAVIQQTEWIANALGDKNTAEEFSQLLLRYATQ